MKFLLSALTVLVVVVAGLIVAPSFIDWNSYKGDALSQFESLTGLKADIKGDVSLAILPSPRVYAENVSIADPREEGEVLAAFKLMDVRVSLPALLSKKIEVTSIHLDDPNVRLIKDAQGQYNFMTPQIEAMMNRDQGSDEKPAQTRDVAVSFEEININNGAFLYRADGSATQLSAINLDINARDLSGPFAVQGSLSYNGQPVELDAKTGEIDPETMATSLNLEAAYGGADVIFAGVVSGGDAPSAQGELTAKIDKLETYAPDAPVKGSASIKGTVSATSEAASLKDGVIDLAGTRLSGSADVRLSPMSVSGAFTAAEALNLDNFIKKGESNQAQSGSPLAFTEALPQTLELPVLGAIDLRFNAPALIYNGARFGSVSMSVKNRDKGFDAGLSINDAPGGGAVQLNGALNFAEKSLSGATQSAIYSAPSVSVSVKGQSDDPSALAEALSGAGDLPLIGAADRAVFDAKVRMTRSNLYLDESVVNLDQDAYAIKGSLSAQGDSGLPLLKASVVADRLNFDTLSSASSASADGVAKKASKGGAMPLDMELDATVHKAVFQGKTINGLKVGARMADQKLVVNRFAASDFDGQKFDVSGVITVDMAAAKPSLEGKIQLGDLTWKSSKTAPNQKSTGEKWPNTTIDSAWMNAANIDFEIAANSINYEGWQLSKPSIDMEMKDGVLKVNDLRAGIYGGSINASATMKPAQGTSGLDIDGKAAIDKVQMEPLVTSLAAGSRLLKGRGIVSIDTSLRGGGTSIKALIGSLSGSGSVSGSDIVIEGIDVQRFVRALSDEAKPGDSALNLWKGVATQGSTSFETLDGSYAVQQGVINIHKLLLGGPSAAINTTGQIALVPWTIDTSHEMSVTNRDDIPPFTVKISGSLDNPANTLAGGVLNDYLQRKIQRKLDKVLSDKLGEKLDEKLGLDGVLKGVLGGASQQPAAPEPAPAPAPANDEAAPEVEAAPEPAPEPAPKEPTPEEAMQELLKGFLR